MSTTMNDPFAGFDSFANAVPAAPNPFGGLQQNPSQEQGLVGSGLNQHNPNSYYQNNGQQAPAGNDNPFATYAQPQQPPQQQQQQQQQSMVPANQQTNQWSMSMQQQPQQQHPTYGNNNMQGSMRSMGGYPQPTPLQTMQQQPGYTHQQGLMTPTVQQRQQQQIVPSSAQSMASSHYMTPGLIPHTPGQGQINSTPVIGTPLQFFSPQQQQQQSYSNNGYMQQAPSQPQQSPPVQPAPTPVPEVVGPAPVVTTVAEEEDDFFGAFSSVVHNNNPPPITSPGFTQSSNRPPTEFDADMYNESISVLSKSTAGTERVPASRSPLDDPRFAPKPKRPHELDSALTLAKNAPGGASPLPDFDLITHSGYALARISFRTIIIKKWKQVFWITYGVHKLLVFRSSADFEDWVSNPYLNSAQRDFLVKLEIDLVEDTKDRTVRGYQVTLQRLKNYSNKMLHQFKIERWMEYGPTIAAAFASPNEREIFQLRTVFSEMINRLNNRQTPNNNQGQQRQVYSYNEVSNNNTLPEEPHRQPFSYSDAASTGRMMHDAGSMGGRSMKSQGVFSTGPIERMRDPSQQAIGGYYPTSRNGFQY